MAATLQLNLFMAQSFLQIKAFTAQHGNQTGFSWSEFMALLYGQCVRYLKAEAHEKHSDRIGVVGAWRDDQRKIALRFA